MGSAPLIQSDFQSGHVRELVHRALGATFAVTPLGPWTITIVGADQRRRFDHYVPGGFLRLTISNGAWTGSLLVRSPSTAGEAEDMARLARGFVDAQMGGGAK